ncbi:transient receptor potential cation channel protein painless-like [Periplaneta americana]|uniref:transient receptor potential cation channel protein painless-like n=1 Tax=Periplaneta americana TaxID=6978 RepID=UPI0037E995E9
MAKNKDVCIACGPPDFQSQLLTALKDRNAIHFSNILQEYDTDGERVVNPDHQYGDPYYATCLDLACKDQDSEDFIVALLAANADPNHVNPVRNKAPIHVATENGNYKAVAALLHDSRTDVNIQDNFGCTALHLAAKNFTKNATDMEICVSLLMTQPNMKINKRNRKGRSAIQEAVLSKSKLAVESILRYGKSRLSLDNKDAQSGKSTRDFIAEYFPDIELPPSNTECFAEEEDIEATTLFEYLYYKQYDTFKSKFELADKKALINSDDGKFTYLQYACQYGLQDIAKYLLSNGADPNATIPTNRKPPIFLACSGGYYDILLLLLECKAQIATVDGKTLLHAVVKNKDQKPSEISDYEKCFAILLERKDSLKLQINATDINGNTALHYAAKEEDQNYAMALLKNGAYIGLENHFGYSPLADIDPMTLRSFLDDCLHSNGKFRRDDKYELTFKYGFLEPPSSDSNMQHFRSQESGQLGQVKPESHKPVPELYPLHYISKSQDLRPLLTHPVLLSFLHLKWSHIRVFFYANLVFYSIFVALLTFHILRDCSKQDVNVSNPNVVIEAKSKHIGVDWILISILLSALILRELFQMVMSPRRYFCSFENCIELLLIIFTVIILSKEWGDLCIRPVDSTAILLAWTELFLQIGHIQVLSTYNEMMRRVLCNYLKFLIWDVLLIIAFALGFYTLFHETKSDSEDEDNFFQQPLRSLFRTTIMLMGEFDISSIPFELVPIISYILFIFFVFLVPLVMVNLLNGLAVSDTQAIKNDAELVSIESMIETIFYFETMLLGDPLSCTCGSSRCCCWPRYINPKFKFVRNLFKNVFLFPHSLPNNEMKVFPNLGQRIFIFPNTVYPKKKPDYDMAMEVDCCGIPGGCCKMDRSVLKAAMDIIDKKSEVSETHLLDRLDAIEQRLQHIQESLNGFFNNER